MTGWADRVDLAAEGMQDGDLIGLIAVFLLAVVFTGVVRRYAERRLLDVPNARSSHRTPTPRGGGVGIAAAFLVGCAYATFAGVDSGCALPIVGGALLVAAVGFWDDHGHVSPHWRLFVHMTAGVLAVMSLPGGEPLRLGPLAIGPGGWADFLAVLGIVWFLNLFNFMDGIDGLAGIEVVCVAGGAAVLASWTVVTPGAVWASASLAVAGLGFLVWNWPPARIFMGDVGSGFLGYLLGCQAIATARSGTLSLAVWLILAGVFCVDATFTLVRRVLTGQRWYQAHRSHAYQHAAQALGSHAAVDFAVLAINGLWLWPLAALAAWRPEWELPVLLLAYGPLIALAVRWRAGHSG